MLSIVIDLSEWPQFWMSLCWLVISPQKKTRSIAFLNVINSAGNSAGNGTKTFFGIE